MAGSPRSARAELNRNALDDLLRGVGLTQRWLRAALSPPLSVVTRGFVREVLEMDRLIDAEGFGAAGDLVLRRFSGPVTVEGAARVPAAGPLLVVANHPGTVDIACLWRVLRGRDDVRIVALDRPLLRAVPHLAERLIYVGPSGVVRQAADHLRGGGALVTFPAGDIEPDPQLRLGEAVANLETWHESTAALVRLVPGLQVLPVAIGGVISKRWLRRPPASWREDPEARELAAATLQIATRDRSIRPAVVVGDVGTQDDFENLLRRAAGL